MIRCRICDGPDLEAAVDLGRQPWANGFLRREELGREPAYPLRVVWCARCHAAQLDFTVPKEVMFADHTYLSGTTETLSRHFKETAAAVDGKFFGKFSKNQSRKCALDIGSNDGTQLAHYRALGYDVLGVEPAAAIARMANAKGIETIGEFFNQDLARRLGRKFHVINASGVFFHLEELHSAAEGVRELLEDDGVFVVQFLYAKDILANLAFDQIYHEHLLYYTLETLGYLLRSHGLNLFDAYWSPIHGGSMIAFASHAGRRVSERLEDLLRIEAEAKTNTLDAYRDFARRILARKIEILDHLSKAKAAGKTIYGLGAPVKGNTLLNHFGIGTQYLDCLVEKNALRRGLYSPGMHIPVLIEDELTRPPDVYFVLAWNFKDEILARNKPLLDRGVEFYFPVQPRQA